MDKEFKTYKEQLEILRNWGLVIDDDSKAIVCLQSENYYNLINGYKDLFLQIDDNLNPVMPEWYLPNDKLSVVVAMLKFVISKSDYDSF